MIMKEMVPDFQGISRDPFPCYFAAMCTIHRFTLAFYLSNRQRICE